MNQFTYEQFSTANDNFYTKYQELLATNPHAVQYLEQNLNTHLDIFFAGYSYFSKDKQKGYVKALVKLIKTNKMFIKNAVMAIEKAAEDYSELPPIADVIKIANAIELKSKPKNRGNCILCHGSGSFTVTFNNKQDVAFSCECDYSLKSDSLKNFQWSLYKDVKDDFINQRKMQDWHKIQGRNIDLKLDRFANPQLSDTNVFTSITKTA